MPTAAVLAAIVAFVAGALFGTSFGGAEIEVSNGCIQQDDYTFCLDAGNGPTPVRVAIYNSDTGELTNCGYAEEAFQQDDGIEVTLRRGIGGLPCRLRGRVP